MFSALRCWELYYAAWPAEGLRFVIHKWPPACRCTCGHCIPDGNSTFGDCALVQHDRHKYDGWFYKRDDKAHSFPVSQKGSFNVLGMVVSIAHRDGWRALFRGNAANVLKAAPQKAIDFFAFEAFKASPWLATWTSPAAATLTAAGLAGATSATVLYPLEVLRSRITCDPAFAGAGVANAARAIVAAEGPRALYRGWVPAVAAIVPEAAIVYGCFDLLKRSYARVTGQQEAGMAASLTFGVTASFLGQLVSYPLETVSRRMQLARSDAVLRCAQALWTAEGVAGFYRGLPAATARTVPMAVLSFGTYELVRRWLLALEESQQCRDHAVQQSLARHTKVLGVTF